MESYGLALNAAAMEAYEPEFVAVLAVQLPQDCRWRVSYERDAWWNGDRLLQASLINSLNGLIWALGDKKKRGPRPQPIGPSSMKRGAGRSLPARVMSSASLLEELSKPRKAG